MNRPCIEPGCRGMVYKESRCKPHYLQRHAARNANPKRQAYEDPAYRRTRALFKGLPCVYCGAPSDTVEHLIKLKDGGTNHPSNLAPCCKPCNDKGGKHAG